jgi:hypothetical protein
LIRMAAASSDSQSSTAVSAAQLTTSVGRPASVHALTPAAALSLDPRADRGRVADVDGVDVATFEIDPPGHAGGRQCTTELTVDARDQDLGSVALRHRPDGSKPPSRPASRECGFHRRPAHSYTAIPA